MASIFDTNLVNPCSIWISFKAGADQGYFQGYDKDVEDDDQRIINLGENLNIIPLYEHYGVEGFNNESGRGIYSNEIESMDGILHVKIGDELFVSGKWDQIKEKVKAKRGKFANVVYFAFFQRNNEGEIVPRIGAMKFSGALSNEWINAKVRLNEMKLLQLSKGELISKRIVNNKEQKLKNPYWRISIKKYKKPEELIEVSIEFAKELKGYFDEYFKEKNQNFLNADNPEVRAIGEPSVADINAEFSEHNEDGFSHQLSIEEGTKEEKEKEEFDEFSDDLPF